MKIDHMILPVNELDASRRFYCDVLGMRCEGPRPPFEQIRVDADFVLLLSPFGTEGGQHLAFSLPPGDFDAVFDRIRAEGMPFGDEFDKVGNGRGPGPAEGAHGDTQSVYCFDPNQHLIEIVRYA